MKYTSCFIGIPLPEEFAESFSALLSDVKKVFPGIELADASSPHITMYYLDQKSQNNIEEISKTAEKSMILIADTQLGVGGMGVFDTDNPRVLYLCVKFEPELLMFRSLLAEALASYGAEDNDMGFVPHITVGRIPMSSRDEFLEQKEKLGNILESIEWSFEVDRVSIFGADSRIQPEKQERLVDIRL